MLLDQRNQDLERLRYELWAAEVALQAEVEARPKEEPKLKFANTPLYMSEEQEDVQWQLDHDMIDTKTAQALLKDLEFENSEVQLADEYTYENFHY